MTFIFGLIIGAAIAGTVAVLRLQRQQANWDAAIAGRRTAERQRQNLRTEVARMQVDHKSEVRTQREGMNAETAHYQYLLRRADSALAAARELRDQQAREIASLTDQSSELSQTA